MRRARLVLPSGPISPERLDKGIGVLSALGIPHVGPTLPAETDPPYLAGADTFRAAELTAAMATGDRLLAARGGYGALRTLDALDKATFETPSGPELWAFSDGTALLGAWVAAGWTCWSSPPLVQLPRLEEASRQRFVEAWSGRPVADFAALETIVEGVATGPLAGGNLCILASLLGTPWQVPLHGTILLLEDVGEAPYRVDRLFSQLRLAGALDGVAGVALGEFTGLSPAQGRIVDDLFDRELRNLGVPAARGMPFGHGAANACLPMGRQATLTTRRSGAATLTVS